MDAVEPTLICPYNKSHAIISSRMQFHLTKCRIQHPTSEKAVCPFNSTHIIPKVEYEVHKKCCENRDTVDRFAFRVGSSQVPKVELVSEPIPITGDENWDVSDVPPVSVLDKVHEASKQKPALQALIGAPKSERKAFRTQERLRIQRVLDSQGENRGGAAKKIEEAQRKAEREELMMRAERERTTEESAPNYYIRNRMLMHAGGQASSQNTDLNAPGTSRGPPNRDPRRTAWGTTNENIMGSANFPKLIPDSSEGPRPGTSRDVQREVPEPNRRPISTRINRPSSPVRERDPGNPWRVTRQPQPPVTSTSNTNTTDDAEDFPSLPLASRGRGRFKSKRQ